MYLEQEVKSARDKERAAVFIPPKERSKDKKKNKVSSHPAKYLADRRCLSPVCVVGDIQIKHPRI